MIVADVVWLITHGGSDFAHQALRYPLVYSVGVGGVLAGVGHTVFRDQVADSIGWPKGNPFQIEVGFANAAIGVAGVLCAWYAGRFWLATIVIVSVYLASAAAVHVVDMVRSSNDAPGRRRFRVLVGPGAPGAALRPLRRPVAPPSHRPDARRRRPVDWARLASNLAR